MNKNNTVDTAQKGQTTTKNTQPENVVKDLKKIDEIRKNKSKVPTGKVTLLKETEARKKAREEQYRNFRIGAMRRRCKRYGFDEEKTKGYVEALIKQLDEPKQYNILIMLSDCEGVTEKSKNNDEKDLFKSPATMLKEAFKEANIKYNMCCESHCMLTGDQKILAKIREIVPDGAKIYPYAKKMECVIPEDERKAVKAKKPSNNTAEKKAAAKAANKGHMPKSVRYLHRMQKGRYKALRSISLAYKRSKKHKAITVQLDSKTSSKGSKRASTNLKKAA